MEQGFEIFFKPEIRKRGSDYFKKDAVVISVGSDTLIEGYVKGVKTSFKAKSITDDTFSANCSCSSAGRGQLCPHIWALLLLVEKKHPDFLSSKNKIEKATEENPKKSAFKAQQLDYKKQQYQKQKLRAQALKDAKKKNRRNQGRPEYPEDVERALSFFAENGFPLEFPCEEEILKNARKKLSRVFHPDVGGSHQESVALNVNYDVLFRYLEF